MQFILRVFFNYYFLCLFIYFLQLSKVDANILASLVVHHPTCMLLLLLFFFFFLMFLMVENNLN